MTSKSGSNSGNGPIFVAVEMLYDLHIINILALFGYASRLQEELQGSDCPSLLLLEDYEAGLEARALYKRENVRICGAVKKSVLRATLDKKY
jgi:hypothetical protein